MPATPINVGEKYSALSGLKILFLPVVAAASRIPTRMEINAGTDLSTEIMEWEGFTLTSDNIDTPGLARFTGTIPGRLTAEDSSLTLYADRGGDDVRDVLPRDTRGFIALMDNGDVPTSTMDVWPVQVKTLAKMRSTDNATMLKAEMNITDLPAEDATIPAATP